MGDFTPEVTPQHFNRIEPGTVSGQVKQNQPACSPTDNRLNFIILMSGKVVPGDIDNLIGVFIEQCL